MKKTLSLILLVIISGAFLFSCGEKDKYSSVCSQLEKTAMNGTQYSQSQINEFENRFAKINLEAGFSRVTHFRSQYAYAYVIEFEKQTDAQTFYDVIIMGDYDVKMLDAVVIYGDSNSINKLK